MRRIVVLVFSFLLIGFVFLLSFYSAEAFVIKSGNSIVIPKNQTIDDTLIVSGQHIRIDGNVNGDIFCAGQIIDITSAVSGDVMCAGQTITINSIINGNIRAAGQTIAVGGEVKHNITTFGQSITNNAIVDGDTMAYGQNVVSGSIVKRDLNIAAQSADIEGIVNRNAILIFNQLTLGNKAHIAGNLDYTSDKQSSFIGLVGGNVTYHQSQMENRNQRKLIGPIFGVTKFISIIVHLLIALFLVVVWPKTMLRVSDVMMTRAGKAIGWGAVILFATPLVGILIALTLIGIPLTILLFIAYALAIFLSRLFVGITIGRIITASYWKAKKNSVVWSTTVGVVLTWIVYAIPVIGWLLACVAILWGLGGVWYLFSPFVLERQKK